MKNKKLLSVGIPAYNESGNIKKLIKSILSQAQDNFRLKEIIVVSDGSTDSTYEKAKKYNSSKLRVVKNKKRMGKSFCLKEIIKKNKSDILILIDADVYIDNSFLFSSIVNNCNFKKAGIAAVNASPIDGKTYFEKILQSGVVAMKQISKLWLKSHNYLAFRGSLLALDRRFSKKSQIDENLVNNDSFFYFKAIELGYSPIFFENLFVYYKLPSNFTDHKKQSLRHSFAKNELRIYLNKDLSKKLKIPFQIYFFVTLSNIAKNFIYFFPYLIISFLIKFGKKEKVKNKWMVAESTKKGVYVKK